MKTPRLLAAALGGALFAVSLLALPAPAAGKFYVQDYDPHETFRAASPSDSATQAVRVPLLNYPRFVDNPALASHIVDLGDYDADLTRGTLPAVAFIASSRSGDRSPRSLDGGQRFARDLVTQLSQSGYWGRSAFLVSYDSAGGWYDHVVPPRVAGVQLGFRVPALLVSPYAKAGVVVHTSLDVTSALAFIERNWRIAPLSARDARAGSLADAFAFNSAPRPPEIVPVGAVGTSPPRSSVNPIYWAYGLGSLGVAVMIASTFALPVVSRRRRRRPSAAVPAEGAKEPVT